MDINNINGKSELNNINKDTVKQQYSPLANEMKNSVKGFKEKNASPKKDSFKGNNYTRGLKVIDDKIANCNRADFESDEAYKQQLLMLTEQRATYVTTEADAKVKRRESGSEAASKVLNSVGNFLGTAAKVAGTVLDIAGAFKTPPSGGASS